MCYGYISFISDSPCCFNWYTNKYLHTTRKGIQENPLSCFCSQSSGTSQWQNPGPTSHSMNAPAWNKLILMLSVLISHPHTHIPPLIPSRGQGCTWAALIDGFNANVGRALGCWGVIANHSPKECHPDPHPLARSYPHRAWGYMCLEAHRQSSWGGCQPQFQAYVKYIFI